MIVYEINCRAHVHHNGGTDPVEQCDSFVCFQSCLNNAALAKLKDPFTVGFAILTGFVDNKKKIRTSYVLNVYTK